MEQKISQMDARALSLVSVRQCVENHLTIPP